ncbi:Uncharacterized protein Fot_35301 [Forsythia ovata]|uniref:Uncharacterized protein n=1 Tax=Forsythia ovata TaxID=205694 RepID=A0ABD1SL59_9LAMI
MKVADLRSTVRRGEDIDVLCSENKDLRAQLDFSEDASTLSIYDITEAGMIQWACVQAQRMAESQLRACQNIIHAKDKELTEALTEFLRAKDLLANLRESRKHEKSQGRAKWTWSTKLERRNRGRSQNSSYGRMTSLCGRMGLKPKEQCKPVEEVVVGLPRGERKMCASDSSGAHTISRSFPHTYAKSAPARINQIVILGIHLRPIQSASQVIRSVDMKKLQKKYALAMTA